MVNRMLVFLTQKLKLVSAIFYQIFVFPLNDSPSKTMKSVFFLFHQKSSFHSQDIQTFVIFPFPHFPDTKGKVVVE